MLFAEKLDGGYAWIIMLASFVTQFLTMGAALSVGILYSEWANYFNEKTTTAWIASLSNCLILSLGPLSGVFTNYFGHRRTILFGSGIATFGCCVSYFATEAWHLIVSYGVLVGIGSSLMYIPAVTVVPFWFSVHRNAAMSFAVVGASFGSVCYPLIYRSLIDEYTWRGAMLILAGFYLNISVLAAIIKTSSFEECIVGQFPKSETAETLLDQQHDAATCSSNLKEPRFTFDFSSSQNSPCYVRREISLAENSSPLPADTCMASSSATSQYLSPITAAQLVHLQKLSMRRISCSTDMELSSNSPSPNLLMTSMTDVNGTCDHDEQQVYMRRKSTYAMAMSERFNRRSTLLDYSVSQDQGHPCPGVDPDILCDPIFYVFLVCEIFWNVGLFVMYTISPDYAFSIGISIEKSSYLVTFASVCGGIAQFVIAPVDSCRHPNTMLIFSISTLLTVPFMVAFVLSTSYPLLAVSMSLFGFWAGMQNGILPVVHGDYYAGKTEIAFGYVSLADGIGGLIAPALASHIFSMSGSYEWAYIIGSLLSGISGLCYLLVYAIKVRKLKYLQHIFISACSYM